MAPIQSEVALLKDAFKGNPQDIGLGLVNPTTGEIRLGSFDATNGLGHQGLANTIGVTNNSAWRGFIVTADGRLIPKSHLNVPDGSLALRSDLAILVEQALRQVGLVR